MLIKFGLVHKHFFSEHKKQKTIQVIVLENLMQCNIEFIVKNIILFVALVKSY